MDKPRGNPAAVLVGCGSCPINLPMEFGDKLTFDQWYAENVGKTSTCKVCGTVWILKEVYFRGSFREEDGRGKEGVDATPLYHPVLSGERVHVVSMLDSTGQYVDEVDQ